MFRVEIVEEVKNRGVFRYRVAGLPIAGCSRQPLLDACREIKRISGPTASLAGLFRAGRPTPDLFCPVEWGAAHTVEERSTGGIKFAKYREFDPGRMAEAAE
jgi:hypothetical protein